MGLLCLVFEMKFPIVIGAYAVERRGSYRICVPFGYTTVRTLHPAVQVAASR